MVAHGKYTAELGRGLRIRVQALGSNDLKVYFDHGTKGESKRIVPYFNDYDTSTTLAFVDLSVVKTETKSVLVLCEVEEDGANPKKVIGDCCNILLSDYLCIDGERYDLSNARFLLGVNVGSKGKSSDKIAKLRSRIVDNVRADSLKCMKLEFVCQPDCESLIRCLEERIYEIVCGDERN